MALLLPCVPQVLRWSYLHASKENGEQIKCPTCQTIQPNAVQEELGDWIQELENVPPAPAGGDEPVNLEADSDHEAPNPDALEARNLDGDAPAAEAAEAPNLDGDAPAAEAAEVPKSRRRCTCS